MTWTWPPRNRRFGTLDAVALVGVVGLLIARFVPIARLPFWGCSFRAQFGIPCPGCGLTRVADRMSHFEFARAFDANPLGALVASAFLVAIVLSALHLVFAVPMPSVQFDRSAERKMLWGGVALFVVNYGFLLGRAVFP